MLREIVEKCRTRRRFYEERPLSQETLLGLVDMARLSASAGNLQPLKYIISVDRETNRKVFETLAWAGYLTDWDGPEEGERPSGYVIILGDTEIGKNFDWDAGIAAQTIMLGATEQGLGGCMFGSINRRKLRESLSISERYEILLVIALGYPKEQVVIEEIGPDGDIKYYRDAEGVHHVPKRRLDDIILSK